MTVPTPNHEQDDAIERLALEHGDCRISTGRVYGVMGLSFHVDCADGYRCMIFEDGTVHAGVEPR